jgi:hypothetical protein
MHEGFKWIECEEARRYSVSITTQKHKWRECERNKVVLVRKCRQLTVLTVQLLITVITG